MRLGFKGIRLQSFLTVALLLAAGPAMAQMKCQIVLTTPPAYGTLRPDFVHNTTYSIELKNQSDVKNQCGLGTCNVHSWASWLEANSSVRVSTAYLSAKQWFMKTIAAIDSDHDFSKPLDLGYLLSFSSDVMSSRMTILLSGLIPVEVWKGGENFQKSPAADKMREYIRNIVAREKLAEKYAQSKERLAEIRAQAKAQIADIFREMVGEFPKTFMYQGNEYTPHTFLKTFFPVLFKPIVKLEVHLNGDTHTTVEDFLDNTIAQYTGEKTEENREIFIKTNIDEVERTALELIRQGKNVFWDYISDWNYIDFRTGIASISALRTPENGEPLSREESNFFTNFSTGGGHAVQIVGCDVDPVTGKVIKWKVKNSGGTGSGDHGYFHVYADYFRRFTVGISFLKESNVTLPEATPKN
jgi:bleomycin hydrolase